MTDDRVHSGDFALSARTVHATVKIENHTGTTGNATTTGQHNCGQRDGFAASCQRVLRAHVHCRIYSRRVAAQEQHNAHGQQDGTHETTASRQIGFGARDAVHG